MTRFVITIALLTISTQVGSHHSIAAFYDNATASRLDGTIVAVDWVNPHVRFRLETIDESGETETWALESGSINMLDRQGISRDVLEVGQTVSILGHLSRHGRKEMIAGYITSSDGESVVLWSGLFGGRESEFVDPAERPSAAASSTIGDIESRGIFRVWTVGATYSDDVTDTIGSMALPYTAAALVARDAYDPVTEDTALRCIPQGMPGIMDNPFPMQLIERGDEIILRLEEWDVERTIHMNDATDPSVLTATPHGYSTGRWEGDALVVTTTRIDWPYFDDVGTPQSDDVEVVETFTLSADETRLDYSITVTDPATFSAPATMDGYWTWTPGERIKEYNCAL